MERRVSIVMTAVFIASFVQFSIHLVQDWGKLGPQVRMDEIYLAGLFLGLVLQLWRENSKTSWMLITTATIAFAAATHLVMIR